MCDIGRRGLVCGGPIAGMAFPFYQGGLSRDSIARYCFRCGAPAHKVLEVFKGGTDNRYVGTCKEHLKQVLPYCINALEANNDREKK